MSKREKMRRDVEAMAEQFRAVIMEMAGSNLAAQLAVIDAATMVIGAVMLDIVVHQTGSDDMSEAEVVSVAVLDALRKLPQHSPASMVLALTGLIYEMAPARKLDHEAPVVN